MNRDVFKNLALVALMVVVLVLIGIGAIGFQQARKVTTTETTEFPNDPNAPGAADYYGPQYKIFQDRTRTPEPMPSETFDESMVVKCKTATDNTEEEPTTKDPEPKSGWNCDITPSTNF